MPNKIRPDDLVDILWCFQRKVDFKSFDIYWHKINQFGTDLHLKFSVTVPP